MFAARFFGGRYFGRRYFGKTGLLLDGAYNGSRFLGVRYFGSRYFGSNSANIPFALAVTNTVAVAGVVTLGGGNLVFGSDWAFTQVTGISVSGAISLTGGSMSFDNAEWSLTPPIPVGQITGAVTVGGNFSINGTAPGYGGYFGRRYFGGRFYGPRYFGASAAWRFTQVTGIGLSGAIGVAGGIETALSLNPNPGEKVVILLSGTVGVSGGFVIDAPTAAAKSDGGGRKRRYPNWAKQPARLDDPPPAELRNRLAAADLSLLALVQGLYDAGTFDPKQ